MEKYDLCIIGGGPAGYAGAMRAIDFGKKVILIEKDKVGGAGLYDGALSSKTMWEFSNQIANVKSVISEKAIANLDISYEDLMNSHDTALFDRKFQLSCHIKLLESESYKGKFTYARGEGSLANKHEVLIKRGNKKDDEIIYADNILLATGSSPRRLPNIPIDEQTIVTSDGIHRFTDFPESLVILGAGVIGCEFATIFSNMGKTKVSLIDKADRILPFEDPDISETVAQNLEKNGVKIHKNSSLERMEIIDGKVEYELSYKDGHNEVFHVEKALVSVGRVPNTAKLGLEELNVAINQRGMIADIDTCTNVENIYAAGDVTGHIALVNVGELEARHAVEKMFGGSAKKMNYTNVSTIMFLNPEVAAVGINEQQAMEQKIPIRVVKIDYSCIARAIAMRKTNGFFKIIVSDDDEMKLLGMRAVGEHASSAIQAVALLISMNKGIDELADLIHPHPSIIEGIQECVRMLRGNSIFKSEVFEDLLKCYRCHNGVCTPMEHLKTVMA